MPAKVASARVSANVVGKSASATGMKSGVKKARMSRLEAKRLESFKALIAKYAGKCSFAGSDE